MSAADEVAHRLSRVYVRAIRPHELETTTLNLLEAIIALAYTEGVQAGAESLSGIVNTSFDEAIKQLTEMKRNGGGNEPA